jgi:hypothetical protein
MERMNSFNRKLESQERRAVEVVWVYIKLSQKYSRCSKIRNLDIVRLDQTLFGQGFCEEIFELGRLEKFRTLYGWAEQCLARGFCFVCMENT